MIPDTRTAVAATVSMEEFAKRVGFRLEDLALNRAGKVSSHQLSESYRQATVLAGAALVSLGMAVVICLGKLNSIQSIIPGVIVAAVGIISAVFCLKVLGATWAPKVASSEGNIEPRRLWLLARTTGPWTASGQCPPCLFQACAIVCSIWPAPTCS
jgi:hypothetical protein